MTNPRTAVLLKIEFQRVQTYLFQVPRLAAMDGANALLGDLVRQQLPKALSDFLCHTADTSILAPLVELENALRDAGDPVLGAATPTNAHATLPCDIPSQSMATGLLVRDGGRVFALIQANRIDAAKAAAAACIQCECPGLAYTIDVQKPGAGRSDAEHGNPSSASATVGLPCFRWCDDSGLEPASSEITVGDDKRKVSRSVVRRIEAHRIAKHGSSLDARWDIASLLYAAKDGIPAPKADEQPDFDSIAGGNYLAVVHMDGNAIGDRSKDLRKQTNASFLQQQAELEPFFLSMRSAMRRAVVTAVKKHFHACPKHYRLLMLGGDDVLLVCRADKALPLVRDVAAVLADINLADGKPLTIGAGIAIAKPNLPFHRLHAMAEELAKNAKRISIGPDNKHRSVVDWMVTTASWVDSVDSHRAEWNRVRYPTPRGDGTETLLLTAKPYPILADGNEPSLAKLIELADALRGKHIVGNKDKGEGMRSQLKWFASELRKGKCYAELMWHELPEAFRKDLAAQAGEFAIAPARDSTGDAAIWHRIDASSHTYRTWLADLFELIELPLIGRKDDKRDAGGCQTAEEQHA